MEPTTILCVDDEETPLRLRQRLLESAGYRVLTAKSGMQGISTFRSAPIDAVIVDYWMADMNGLETAQPDSQAEAPRADHHPFCLR